LTGEASRIGVDLGGTKMEVLALGPGGEERFRHRVATPRGYNEVLAAIGSLVQRAEQEAGEGTVGVGAPGSLSPASALWRNCNLEFCNGRDLIGDLSGALSRPVRVENDANCFALSEAIDGAGAGAWIVYGVTAGTGLGGGMAVGGRLNRGGNGAAAEIGHVPLPWLQKEDFPLPRCYCGLHGCAEQYLSGKGIARDFQAATGTAATGETIMAWAAEGRAEALTTVDRFHDRFARFLSVIVNILDPDVIVLGGGLSKVPGICEAITPRISRTTFARDVAVRFVPAMHGDSSGVRGAAWLWGAGSE
jgi:fructokinase